MRKIFVTAIAALTAVGTLYAADPKVWVPDSTGFIFTDTKVIPTTPVKDQHKSGTCWCYSTNSFFESEILRKTGKQIHLSEGFVVNHCYKDKAERYVRMDGTINFAEGGAAGDVNYVWNRYGMVPNDVYTGLTHGDKKFQTNELTDILKGYLSVVKRNERNKLTPAWREGFNAVIDSYMGKLPETFVWEGVTYTPKSYAESLPIKMSDYVSIASFTHHPFYQPFVLEVADNWLWSILPKMCPSMSSWRFLTTPSSMVIPPLGALTSAKVASNGVVVMPSCPSRTNWNRAKARIWTAGPNSATKIARRRSGTSKVLCPSVG